MNFHLITSHRFSRIWTCSSFFENKFHSINLVHCEKEREREGGEVYRILLRLICCYSEWCLCVTNGNVCGECEKMNQSPIDPFPATYFIKFIWLNLSCWASFLLEFLENILRVNMQISYKFFNQLFTSIKNVFPLNSLPTNNQPKMFKGEFSHFMFSS